MDLGAFSISLAVKDLEASREFYQKFGFTVFAGDAAQNWLILKSGNHVIGLFRRYDIGLNALAVLINSGCAAL